jgi:hypothetical protein
MTKTKKRWIRCDRVPDYLQVTKRWVADDLDVNGFPLDLILHLVLDLHELYVYSVELFGRPGAQCQ